MLKLECIHYHVVFLSLHPHCTLSIYPRPLYLYHANSIPPLIYVEPSCSSMSYAHPHTTHKHIIHTHRDHPIQFVHFVVEILALATLSSHHPIMYRFRPTLVELITRCGTQMLTHKERKICFNFFYARWRTTMQHHALGASFHLVMFDLYVPPKTKQIWGANEILA